MNTIKEYLARTKTLKEKRIKGFHQKFGKPKIKRIHNNYLFGYWKISDNKVMRIQANNKKEFDPDMAIHITLEEHQAISDTFK